MLFFRSRSRNSCYCFGFLLLLAAFLLELFAPLLLELFAPLLLELFAPLLLKLFKLLLLFAALALFLFSFALELFTFLPLDFLLLFYLCADAHKALILSSLQTVILLERKAGNCQSEVMASNIRG